MSNAMDVIVFEVGGRRLALDLSRVQEVFTLGYVTALPVVSDAIRGATNLRGRMVPVISLEPLFGLSVGSWVRPGAPAILISTDEATAGIIGTIAITNGMLSMNADINADIQRISIKAVTALPVTDEMELAMKFIVPNR